MHTAIIINSSIGHSRLGAIIRFFARETDDHEVGLFCTQDRGHATQLAREAIDMGANMLVAVGGDGTANEVFHGMLGSRCRLALIPAGTANDLARHIGMPDQVADAWNLIRNGAAHSTDVMRVNDRYFLTTCGVGLPDAAVRMGQRIQGRTMMKPLKRHKYLLGLLATLFKGRKHLRLKITVDGTSIVANTLSLTASNIPVLGSQFRVAPVASINDGLLTLCLMGKTTWRKSLATIWQARRGQHLAAREVYCVRARRVRVEAEQPITFFADGESAAPTSELDLEAYPGALQLVTPTSAEVS